MIGYYQNTEAGDSTWIEFNEENRAQILPHAYHVGIYSLESRPGAEVDDEKIKRKGDLWIDIDFKPENDSSEKVHEAILHAIESVQKLANYLSEHLDDCLWYATGKKGFHVCIPGKLFGGNRAMHNLPRIHKYMATTIAERVGMEGVDLSLYCMGKGKMLRVENKQRANGKYKVRVTPDEIMSMTPELYAQLTSAPREM